MRGVKGAVLSCIYKQLRETIMPAPVGHIAYRGSGRPKGSPNKVTRTVRETFEHAFNMLQNSEKANLISWALANPTDFYKLSAKLIPVDMAVQGGITLQVITGVPSAPAFPEPVDITPLPTDYQQGEEAVDFEELC